MTARRSGLGRGLDSLIPDKISTGKKTGTPSPEKGEKKRSDKGTKSAKNKTAKKKGNVQIVPAPETDDDGLYPERTADAAAWNRDIPVEAEDKMQSPADSGGDRMREKESDAEGQKKPENTTEEYAAEKKLSENSIERSAAAVPDGSAVVEMKISLVEPNRHQPRKKFRDETIEELSDSIRQYGVIQPLLVQKTGDYYQIIAGERRWRAAKKAGLKTVPVIIRDFSTQTAIEVSLIENIQREDLNPMEEAKAYERLVREFSMNQEEVAEKVSKNRSTVANSMRLLKLTEEVQDYVADGLISEGHARALLGLSDPVTQKAAADEVIKNHFTVRETEKLVRSLTKPENRRRKDTDEKKVLLGSLSEQLKKTLGTKVTIHQSGKNKGKIEIEYYSDEELNRIYELIQSIQ